MKKIRRDDRVRLFLMGDNKFEVRNREDDVVLDADADYFIYMKNVNFRNGNVIDGRYLGNLTNDSSILDDHCKDVSVSPDGKSFVVDGKRVQTASMVAVNNKTKVVIIIAD